MEPEWIMTWATVGALVLSAGLGAWSIGVSVHDRKAARDERIMEGTRLYINVELVNPREVTITLHNTSTHPILNIVAAAHPYDSSSGQAIPAISDGPAPTVSINDSFVPPRSTRTFTKDIASHRFQNLYEFYPWAWFGYFHDHEGRAWVHHPSGKVERRSEFAEQDKPIEGPLTIEADKNPKS